MKKINKILSLISLVPISSLIAIVLACIIGFAASLDSAMQESAWTLWILSFAILAPLHLENIKRPIKNSSLYEKICAAFILLSSFIFSTFGFYNSAIAAALIAMLLFFGNLKATKVGAIPIIIWTVAIPNIEFIQYFLSFPMRIIGTHVASVALNVLGFASDVSGTIISVGDKQIAITAACSGIEQLEAMLLIGWVVVVFLHKRMLYRLIHFCMILPVILFINSLRLIVTVAGCEIVGDVFLSDEVHSALGLISVVLVAIIFSMLGALFPKNEDGENEHLA